MGIADELIKYKEMLDDGIISEDEFSNVKEKLLMGPQTDTPPASKSCETAMESKSNRKRKNDNKKLFFVLGGIFLIIAIIFGIGKTQDFAEASRAKKAVSEKVAPIMADYGIESFKIKDLGSIECEEYENLSKKDKFELLYKLDRIDSVTTSKGETVDLSNFDIYVSPSGYYYRVTTLQVAYMGNYSTAGLYYIDGGGPRCVYEIEN